MVQRNLFGHGVGGHDGLRGILAAGQSAGHLVHDLPHPGEHLVHRQPVADQARRADGDLDGTRPVAVHCKGGYRSAIAASLLQRSGFPAVVNVTGGFDAWVACGLPVAAAAVAH